MKLLHPDKKAFSEIFIVFSLIFFELALSALNRDLNDIVSWQTVLILTAIVAIFVAYFFGFIGSLVVGLTLVPTWFIFQGGEWLREGANDMKSIVLFTGTILIMMVYLIIGFLKFTRDTFDRVYIMINTLAVTGILLFLSTREGFRSIEEMTKGYPIWNSWKILVSLIVLLIILTSLVIRAINLKKISYAEVMGIILLSALFIFLVVIPQQKILKNHSYYALQNPSNLTKQGVLFAIISNILSFLEMLGIILMGYARKIPYLINIGIISMFFLIIIKYFDWFFTSLDKSIFFIGAGVLMFLVGALLEKGRRYMIGSTKEK